MSSTPYIFAAIAPVLVTVENATNRRTDMRTNEELGKLCYGDLLRLAREQEEQIALLADEVRRLRMAMLQPPSVGIKSVRDAGWICAVNGEPIE
jgi:hypothetical protein